MKKLLILAALIVGLGLSTPVVVRAESADAAERAADLDKQQQAAREAEELGKAAADALNEYADICGNVAKDNTGKNSGSEVKTAFDFGCRGQDYKIDGQEKPLNPVVDIAFAIFRFLTKGVGLVVIATIIIAGIQYSTSRGDPKAVGAAQKRVIGGLSALLLYIFLYSLLMWLVPGGLFRG